jgi:hypothetical protein
MSLLSPCVFWSVVYVNAGCYRERLHTFGLLYRLYRVTLLTVNTEAPYAITNAVLLRYFVNSTEAP